MITFKEILQAFIALVAEVQQFMKQDDWFYLAIWSAIFLFALLMANTIFFWTKYFP